MSDDEGYQEMSGYGVYGQDSHCRLRKRMDKNHRFENRMGTGVVGRARQSSSKFGNDLVLDEFVEGGESESQLLRFRSQHESQGRRGITDFDDIILLVTVLVEGVSSISEIRKHLRRRNERCQSS